jgi:putative MATE family efflux protein
MNTVITSLVAKCVGENDRETANRHFDSVIKIVIVLSIVLSAVSVALARPIMLLCSHQMDTLDASVTYFRIVMAGMIFNTIYMAINAALRGCGHTGLTFTSNVIFCCVNIFFNYLLIEGHMGFPALGIAGAAIATVAGMAAAFLFMLFMGCKKDLFVNSPYCISKKYKLSKEGTAEIREMSRSTITDGLATRVSILIIGSIVARIGSYQMAVYSVGTQLMSINQALGTGLMTAGVVLIGRSFGAKDKVLLNRYRKQITKFSFYTAVPLGLAIMLGGKWFYGFFSNDPEFVHLGAVSCIFIGLITLSQTLKFAYTGFLQGVGAMKEVMKASIVSFAGVNLGVLALTVFVLDMGIWGAWTGSLASQTFQAIMLRRYIGKNDAFRE